MRKTLVAIQPLPVLAQPRRADLRNFPAGQPHANASAARHRSGDTTAMKPRKNLDPATLRRRRDPPTLEEAVYAAQGLTADRDQQVSIAASLIGLPEEEVRATVLQTRAVASSRSSWTGSRRSVVVEQRRPRAPLHEQRREDR